MFGATGPFCHYFIAHLTYVSLQTSQIDILFTHKSIFQAIFFLYENADRLLEEMVYSSSYLKSNSN